MIAPLRRRHRRFMVALAISLPVLYAVALAGRAPAPTVATLSPALVGEAPAGEVVRDFGTVVAGQAIAVRLRGDGSSWWIELEPREPVARPGVLVYWAPRSPPTPDALPPDAFLLGSLPGQRARAFGVPEGALGRAGRLVLYSLGHQEVIASTPLPVIGATPAEAVTKAGETS